MDELKQEPKEPKFPQFNKWMIISTVLAVLLLASVAIQFGSGITGMAISEQDATDKAFSYISANFGVNPELVESGEENGLYYIDFMVDTQKFKMYISKDGELLFPQVFVLAAEIQQPAEFELTKAQRPVLEAFVSPYCPYGLQYMKGMMPVYDLLKDKADFEIRHIGVTHAALEEEETKRQLCIKNEYGNDKLFEYLNYIIFNDEAKVCYDDLHQGEHAGDEAYFATCITPIINEAISEISADEAKINTCMETNGDTYYDQALSYSGSKNIHSSPTPMMNSMDIPRELQSRSPEGIKSLFCTGFENAPSECGTTLSSETPAAGISGTPGSTGTGSCD